MCDCNPPLPLEHLLQLETLDCDPPLLVVVSAGHGGGGGAGAGQHAGEQQAAAGGVRPHHGEAGAGHWLQLGSHDDSVRMTGAD